MVICFCLLKITGGTGNPAFLVGPSLVLSGQYGSNKIETVFGQFAGAFIGAMFYQEIYSYDPKDPRIFHFILFFIFLSFKIKIYRCFRL